MSINEYFDSLEDAARFVLVKAKAIEVCRFHPDVTIRVGSDDAEHHAYALATNLLKRDGTTWMRDDLRPVIKIQLDMAAYGECPECEALRDK